MKGPRLDRRQVLRAGGIALTLPFLETFAPRQAAAQASPKRLLLFFVTDGIPRVRIGKELWFPNGSPGTNFTMAEVSAGLEPWKSQLVMAKGVHSAKLGDNGHTIRFARMLTGGGEKGGPESIDQIIASHIEASGVKLKLRSLELGVGAGAGGMIVRGGSRVPPDNSPASVFQRLFGAGVPPAPGPTPGPATEIQKLHARRKSVLDAVLEELKVMSNRVTAADRARLEAHGQSIRDVENALGLNQSAGQPPTPRPTQACSKNATVVETDFASTGKSQMQLASLAFACDLTRVISIQWSRTQVNMSYAFLNARGSHHLMMHDFHKAEGMAGGFLERCKTIYKWYVTQYTDLLAMLRNADGGGGVSVLDQSLVAWISEFGDGNEHYGEDLPYVLAGKLGGALQPGRYLAYGGEDHTKMLVAWAQMFGAAIPANAATALGTTPLAGLAG